jgi:hypothetical protein
VEHRQGPATRALAPVRKTIYSLKDLREILLNCNRRYLEYLSSLDDFSVGIRALDRLTQLRPLKGRNLQGLNFFSRVEQTLLAALHRPGFNSAGLRRAGLLPLLGQSSPATLSRQLARLRHLGVIKRVLGTIATISPALAAPPSLPAAASPNTPSFLLRVNFFKPGLLRTFSLTGIDAVPPPESSDRLQTTRGRGGPAAWGISVRSCGLACEQFLLSPAADRVRSAASP